MTAGLMASPTAWLAALLAAAAIVAMVRVVRHHRHGPRGRLALLMIAQPVAAGLLFLTLAPPATAGRDTILTVVTRGAATHVFAGEVVTLPEASPIAGATAVPDLATALRRFAPARLRIVGAGLGPRDRDAATGVALDLALSPPPPGLTRLDLPRAVAPGALFTVGGRASGPVELIDPASARVASAVPDAAGDFVVTATARDPGPATFTLRVRAAGRIVETAAVPVWTTAASPPRLLLAAGAPGPEVKYFRRWATDAGMTVDTEIATGAGLDLGTRRTLTALGTTDLAVFDDRSWSALSMAERGAVTAAVRGGMGLLIRIGGPLSDAARGALRSLGFAASAGGDAVPVALFGTADLAAEAARAGPGTRDNPALGGETLPPLSRWPVMLAGAGATPLLRDIRGIPVGLWRAEGRGRIGVSPLADSYRLVLAGHAGRYGEVWSAAVTTLARGAAAAPAGDGTRAGATGGATVGERVTLCGAATVIAPDGRATPLIVDPATRCAGFWPRIAGWHRLAGASFFVAPADAPPGVTAARNGDATRLLAALPVMRGATPRAVVGSPWPWFAAWLAVTSAMWWFERRRAKATSALD